MGNRTLLRYLLIALLRLSTADYILSTADYIHAQEETAQRFEEEIVVRVIDVDVVVTDRQGRLITDLKREDFTLLEDGKPVEIRYFSRVVEGQLADAPVPAEPTAPDAAVAPPRSSAAVRTPLTWVVFLDQTAIPPRHRNQTMKQLQAFLESAMAGGDRGIVASNNGLSFRIQEGLTDVKKRVLQTVGRLQKEPIHQGAAILAGNRLRNDLQSVSPGDRFEMAIAQDVANQINVIIEEEIQRTRSAIHAMSALIDVLARVEGRLAVVYVGAGFNTLPALGLTEAWRARFPQLTGWVGAPKPEDQAYRLEQEITKLYSNLSASRVTVYTVYAGESLMPSADDGGMFLHGGRFGERAELTEGALAREMSDRTGGLFFKANPGLTKQLETMRRDLNNYYSLGYVPKGAPGNQRSVRVKVKAEGARVRHREAVRERTQREEARRAAVASVIAPVRPIASRVSRVPAAAAPAETTTDANPLGVVVAADRPRRAETGLDRLLPFRLAVQMETLTFRQHGKNLRAEFIIDFAIASPDGTVWRVDSREHSLEIPPEESPEALGENVTFSWNVDLSPLRLPKQIPVDRNGMQLLVTVEDRTSHVQSVVQIPIPNG